jgi:hypothetical protein
MGDYFKQQGVPVPKRVNPAEFMIDVVSGNQSKGRDWAKVWLESSQRVQRMDELAELNKVMEGSAPQGEDEYEFASSFKDQVVIVCERAFVQVRVQDKENEMDLIC